MAEFFWGAVVVMIVLMVLVALALRWSVRRARRRVSGWRSRVLEARTSLLSPGPRRDAAKLRGRLQAELRATRDMLQNAPQGLIFRADATAVLGEVTATAAELDAELAAIERFLDPVQQQAALSTVTAQVEQLIAATYTARHTILRTAVQDRTRQLARLSDEIAVQASAADTYRRQDHELNL